MLSDVPVSGVEGWIPMSVDTRTRLLEAAHALFYREGFLSVGLDRILHEVGVTKTTFYNHFPSKDDLIVAVLEHHDRWWQQTFCEMLRERGGLHPRRQLACIFQVLEEMFRGGEFMGCIFINVAIDFPQPHMPAHQAARSHKLAMEQILTDLADACGAEDPRGFAEELSMVMEGSYVTQHVMGKAHTARIAQRVGELVIGKHLPAEGDDAPAPVLAAGGAARRRN